MGGGRYWWPSPVPDVVPEDSIPHGDVTWANAYARDPDPAGAPPDALAIPGLFHLQTVFLKHYRVHGLLTAAAEATGVPQRAVERWQKQPVFAAAFAEAQAVYQDSLRREIQRRAVEGYDVPVYQRGVLVGHERRYSDGLLVQLAKAKLPEFREHAPAAQVNLQNNVVVAWREKPMPDAPPVIDVAVKAVEPGPGAV